jgi:hypothetical protein
MHQKSSVWYGEFKPSITCVARHRFSIIDAVLEDCLFLVAQYDDFDIVEFECFQCDEFPETIPHDRINAFNELPLDIKMHDFLNWIKIDSPTYLSLKSKCETSWSLIYFDNQLWFEIDDENLQRVERTCLLIFRSMKLPAEVIYDFVINHQQQELDVSNFVGVRDSIVQKELSEIGFLGNQLKIKDYGFRHIPMDSVTLSPDEYFISKESEPERERYMRLLLHSLNQLQGDTTLVFVNHNQNLTSPTMDQLSFVAPYFLELKEGWILDLMEKYNCENDLVLVQLPKLIDITMMIMVLPEGYYEFDPQSRIDVALDLIQRALNMCASSDQKRLHLLDPTLDLMAYEGDFGPKLINLVQQYLETNRDQRVFWHCRDLESFRHYFALRKSIIDKTYSWDSKFKPSMDGFPF